MLAHEQVTVDALYTGPGPTVLFFLAEALLEYEQQFSEWRFKHVQPVERIIGPGTGGTGGTLGARYLERTIAQRCFPALWRVRQRLLRQGALIAVETDSRNREIRVAADAPPV